MGIDSKEQQDILSNTLAILIEGLTQIKENAKRENPYIACNVPILLKESVWEALELITTIWNKDLDRDKHLSISDFLSAIYETTTAQAFNNIVMEASKGKSDDIFSLFETTKREIYEQFQRLKENIYAEDDDISPHLS